MKQEDIREKAKKRVEAKKGFYVVAFIFGAISVILVAINLILLFNYRPSAPDVHIWLLFPILIFMLVLGGMYLSIFGLPGSRAQNEDWEDREMRREMLRLYEREGIQLPPDKELSDEDRLELKELDRLKQKWERRDDFV
jgi:hypothetical protein